MTTIIPPGQPVTPAVNPPAGMKPNQIVKVYRTAPPVTHNYIPPPSGITPPP
jgi:hypothetical protein